jgi:hypothetical protein
MLAKLKTFSLLGIDALPVEVEVDVSPAGLPKTVLVGLPEAAVKESTHRVERASRIKDSRPLYTLYTFVQEVLSWYGALQRACGC